MKDLKGMFKSRSSCQEYFKYMLFCPLNIYSDEYGYMHFISEMHRKRFKDYADKANKCNHRITYPAEGLEKELANIGLNRDVWFCNKCSRYVVEIEK